MVEKHVSRPPENNLSSQKSPPVPIDIMKNQRNDDFSDLGSSLDSDLSLGSFSSSSFESSGFFSGGEVSSFEYVWDKHRLRSSSNAMKSSNNGIDHCLLEGYKHYVVDEMDTLQGIAVKFGMTAANLIQINKLYGDIVYPHQMIIVRDSDINSDTHTSESDLAESVNYSNNSSRSSSISSSFNANSSSIIKSTSSTPTSTTSTTCTSTSTSTSISLSLSNSNSIVSLKNIEEANSKVHDRATKLTSSDSLENVRVSGDQFNENHSQSLLNRDKLTRSESALGLRRNFFNTNNDADTKFLKLSQDGKPLCRLAVFMIQGSIILRSNFVLRRNTIMLSPFESDLKKNRSCLSYNYPLVVHISSITHAEVVPFQYASFELKFLKIDKYKLFEIVYQPDPGGTDSLNIGFGGVIHMLIPSKKIVKVIEALHFAFESSQNVEDDDDSEIIQEEHLCESSVERISNQSNFLLKEHVRELCSCLPPRFQAKEWILGYSTQHHGISFHTFLERIEEKSPLFFFVVDSHEYIFGGFMVGACEISNGYIGTGESFLFQVAPQFQVFKWTEANDYFIHLSWDGISFGGGSGKPGLWIDADFDYGGSDSCETFNNTCLASHAEFKCVFVEVWWIGGN